MNAFLDPEIAVESFVPHYQVDRPIDWIKKFGRQAPLELEIGFGLGEFLIRSALRQPEKNFVGIEQDWLRVKKTLQKLPGVKNVRILEVDATVALERFFRPKTIEKVYCLFPCPWPKKRHIKYRLFSSDFFRLVNSRLVDKGEIQIVTDQLPFRDWMIEELPRSGLEAHVATTSPKFDTKYERKWCEEGQKEFFELLLKKKKHIAIPLKKDEELKIYFAPQFDPDRFQMEETAGDVTVVLKDFIFDKKKEKAMVHLVVAEKTITQHVWVMIANGTRGWCVKRAEGHTALPTKGVARALELVFQAVNNSVGEDRGEKE